ncbi:MAG: DUF6596 domain-containing protein [Pseudorhodobacter sp.]
MTSAAPFAAQTTASLEAVMRADRGRLISALMRQIPDLQLAEDVLHEALASAVIHWGRVGVPENPQAWLLRVAYRKAIDRYRQTARQGRQVAELAILAEQDAPPPPTIPDERLRLIFTCCHPALESKSRVALTLRLLGGLTTAEVARAFLDAESTMGQRLSRAKAKIAAAGIPFAIPEPEDWADRLNSVLTVIYLIFNQGYSSGATAGRSLCEEAIWLAQLVQSFRPDEPEVLGCHALLLLTHARAAARTDASGGTIALDDQDRQKWDRAMITKGLKQLDRAIVRHQPGPFQIKAAIAACHVNGPSPDWPQILALYDSLLRMEPTPIIQLNRAVALAELGYLEAGLLALQPLASALDSYQPYHATKADLLRRSGDHQAAMTAYERAIALCHSEPDARFLRARLAGMSE